MSTQSLAILACRLISWFPGQQEALLFFSLGMFLLGGLLSQLFAAFLAYRLLFRPLEPRDFEPTYWIIMGVNAIGALAGATLATGGPGAGVTVPLQAVLVVLTVFFWAEATWWLPLLLILSLWRHLIRRVSLTYSPSYWGLVIPLGMYATCTFMGRGGF